MDMSVYATFCAHYWIIIKKIFLVYAETFFLGWQTAIEQSFIALRNEAEGNKSFSFNVSYIFIIKLNFY